MIPIKNVYYMLSYSYQVLQEQGYKKIATEEFHNTAEMCASILIKGVKVQLKRGLGREYINEQDILSAVRGKIDLTASIKEQAFYQKQLVCAYDDFSVNTHMNQILKTTMTYLLRADISSVHKKEIKKLLAFFKEVDLIGKNSIRWNVQYNKNNHTYRMLITVCHLVLKDLLQTNSDGSMKLMDFMDEQRMFRLYEKFILEYYKKEHSEINVSASQIPWQLDDDNNTMLPVMQSDIVLSSESKVLIIDAKYYSKTMQKNFNKSTIHSNNLYQIFTYVKNKGAELSKTKYEVSGMLLYAKTDERILPNSVYKMSGNDVIVSTLDLGCDFTKIAEQLDTIVEKYL